MVLKSALTSSLGFALTPVGVGEGLEETAGVADLLVDALATLSGETLPNVIILGPSEDMTGATVEFKGTGADGSVIVPKDKAGAKWIQKNAKRKCKCN